MDRVLRVGRARGAGPRGRSPLLPQRSDPPRRAAEQAAVRAAPLSRISAQRPPLARARGRRRAGGRRRALLRRRRGPPPPPPGGPAAPPPAPPPRPAPRRRGAGRRPP